MTDPRRAGLVVLLAALAGGAVVASLPIRLAALRLAGLGLPWWYDVVIAPGALAVVVAASLVIEAARTADSRSHRAAEDGPSA
jgi:hypothetical protein